MASYRIEKNNDTQLEVENIERKIGQRLKLRRITLGFSQEKLANLLGLTFQQVQKYEQGINRISASRLYEICEVLKVPLDYFFSLNDHLTNIVEEENSAYGIDLLGKRESLELLSAFYQIQDPKVRKKAIDLIKTLKDAVSSNDESKV